MLFLIASDEYDSLRVFVVRLAQHSTAQYSRVERCAEWDRFGRGRHRAERFALLVRNCPHCTILSFAAPALLPSDCAQAYAQRAEQCSAVQCSAIAALAKFAAALALAQSAAASAAFGAIALLGCGRPMVAYAAASALHTIERATLKRTLRSDYSPPLPPTAGRLAQCSSSSLRSRPLACARRSPLSRELSSTRKSSAAADGASYV